jgi:stage II sporulation protein Q
MYRRKLKPFVMPIIYSVIVVAVFTSFFFIKKSLDNPVSKNDDDYIYVDESVFGNDYPVVGGDKVIIRPYTDTSIQLVRSYYDYAADATKQQNSILYYENTYMQNSGVDYSNGKEKFDVVSILDGTVINVNEDNLLGKIVEIRHTNDLISSYQSLSEINVKKGDTVTKGQLIGKSGTCNITSSLNDHLHFEIMYKGKVVDPETFYDKNIKDL